MGELLHSRFSTGDLAENERFSAWREDMSLIFDVEDAPFTEEHPFHATFDLFHFGRAVLAELDASSGRYLRSPQKTRRDGLDAILVQLFLEGEVQFGSRRSTTYAQAGDIVIFDLAQPVNNINTGFRHITAMWPRETLEETQPQIGRWHGRVLPRDSPTVRLLRRHLVASYELAPSLSQAEGFHVEEATLSLLNAAMSPSQLPADSAGNSPTAEALRYQIKRHIREGLCADDLSPEGIAHEFGISRAQLYRLLAPVGGVANYVRDLRLRRCMEQLCDPRSARLQIAEIAHRWGFKNVGTFNRSFRRVFGMTPGEARERAIVLAGPVCPAETSTTRSRREHHQWFQTMRR